MKCSLAAFLVLVLVSSQLMGQKLPGKKMGVDANAGYIPTWQGDPNSMWDSPFYSLNGIDGIIGLGTTEPVAKLHVYNQDYKYPSLYIDGYNGVMTALSVRQDGSETGFINHDGSAFFNGNVGIGTTNPLSKLSLNGTLQLPENESIIWDQIDAAPGTYTYAKISGTRTNSGGSQEGYLSFYTKLLSGSLTERMRIDQNGNVGIGTATPSAKLTVVRGNGSGIQVFSGVSGQYTSYKLGQDIENGTWGVASGGGIYSDFATQNDIVLRADTKNLILTARNSSGAIQFGTGSSDAERMRITSSGNVGIGTTNPDINYKLSVKGKIRSEEVVVEAGWSDFVFEDDYQLPTLDQVEQHIKQNKHLPDIPTAKEVAENGIHLGEMQAKLLLKIEELTLYMIDLKKENEGLKRRVSGLELR